MTNSHYDIIVKCHVFHFHLSFNSLFYYWLFFKGAYFILLCIYHIGF